MIDGFRGVEKGDISTSLAISKGLDWIHPTIFPPLLHPTKTAKGVVRVKRLDLRRVQKKCALRASIYKFDDALLTFEWVDT